MMFSRYALGAGMAGLVFSFTSAQSFGQDLTQQGLALDLITKTANGICEDLKLTSSKTDIKLNAAAKARLGGALGKLADLGIEGDASVARTDKVAGLLDEHVLPAAANLNACRLEVLKALKSELLKPVAAPSTKVSIFCEFPKPNEDWLFAADWDDADRSYVKLDGTLRIPGVHPGRPGESFKVSEHNADKVSWCKYLNDKLASCTTVNRTSGRVQVSFTKEPTLEGTCRKATAPAPGKF